MSEKLIASIRHYNKNERVHHLEVFKKLSDIQKPDAIFIGCSDSRVMPNLFSYSEPGELFMVRNVGNFIPRSSMSGVADGDESEAAAIEYGLEHLNIDDIIVCGHSSCGAMQALHSGRNNIHAINLSKWLRHGDGALKFKRKLVVEDGLSEVDQLSQKNVLAQIENVKTYPIVIELLKANKLRLHAWWFNVETASIYVFNETTSQFELA
ncbi:MAG: carbonic anhydrase [Bacteriovorax sp.]|jgi:carbonic anhydrase